MTLLKFFVAIDLKLDLKVSFTGPAMEMSKICNLVY